MNYKRLCHNRICRVLICLALICCLIAQMVPARAKAVGLSGTVATGTAIAAGLVALGIGVGATETTFNNLVDSLTAVAGSDRVPVWISETADGFVTYLQESFLGSLLAHCFDSGALEVSTAGSFQHDIYVPDLNIDRTYVTSVPTSAVLFLSDSSTPSNYFGELYLLSHENFSQTSPSHYYADFSSAKSLYYIRLNAGQISRTSTFSGVHVVYGKFADTSASDMFPSSVSTTEDLTLGSVGASMSAPNYDPWRSDAIPVVPPIVGGGTADEEDALPVTFPGLDSSSITGQTQASAQSGNTSDTVVTIILDGVPDSSEPTTPDSGDDVVVPPDASFFEGLFGGLESKLDDIHVSFQEIPGLLRELFADIKTSIIELPSKFAEWFENIQTALQELIAGQITIGQLLGEFLSPLIEAFRTLLQSLFVPSSTFVSNKVDSLVAKYPHFNVFIGLGTQLKSFFLSLGSKPPIIYIDLGAATGTYVFGDRQPFIDLTWYAEYKPVMDGILGAFIWLWLAWRIFLMLPGIINGSSGAAGSLVRYSERSMKSQDGGVDR